MKRLILPRFSRVNGRQLPPLTSPAEVGEQLAGLAAFRNPHAALLQTAIWRPAQPDDFGVMLWSVGNPDYGQSHDPGEVSPTMFVCGPTLRDIQAFVAAYIACFDLGGGNCPLFPVFRHQVHVADVSFNRRLWTPGQSREIDPETGRAS